MPLKEITPDDMLAPVLSPDGLMLMSQAAGLAVIATKAARPR